MNRVALRVLIRMLDTLIEQTDEIRYAHKENKLHQALGEALKHLKSAKYVITDSMESAG